MPYYIYELIDPRTDTPAYIGITYDLDARLQQHIRDSRSGTRKSSWIRELLGTDLAPRIREIEVVDAKETAQEREKYWIQRYISSGILLTNTLLISLDSHPKEFYVQAIPLTKNFYTVGEAKRKLRTDTHSFRSMVDCGKIKKLVVPGTVREVYPKVQVDQLAEELALMKATKPKGARKERASKLVKTLKAPRNFYTASEAAQRLGMPKTTFHTYVKQGKIKKVTPPGRTEGFYPKKDIDKLARARELFILEYASEPSTFAQATDEDIKGIYDLCVNLFGVTETASYETLLSWYKKNPRTYYVVKQESIVTGYIGLLYLNEEVTQQIMAETVPGVPMPSSTEVLPFTPGEPIHGLWVGLAVRPGLPSTQARFNGRHLITGAIEVLENLAREGMPVEKLYATARTSDGMRISRKLGFRETIYPGDPLIRYELDLEKSDSPLLSEYKKLAKRYRQREASNSV